MNPDISGMSVWPNYTAGGAKPVQYPGGLLQDGFDTFMGGGFIESFAHGSREARSGKTLSLTTAVATSSAPIFRPRWYTWPVTPQGKTQ